MCEYLVLRVEDEAVDWFALRAGRYVPLVADGEGVVRSVVFPGLWLDAPALLRGVDPGAVAAARAGLGSAARAEFVARVVTDR